MIFEPSCRLDLEQVYQQQADIASSSLLNKIAYELIDFFIINSQRQLIFGNKLLLNRFGVKALTEMIGKRPGEFANCVNATKMPDGCGASEYCKFCGANIAIEESGQLNKMVNKPFRLNRATDCSIEQLDLEIMSKPLIIKGELFYIVCLVDSFENKDLNFLERVFIHDLLNKAGSVSGLIELMNIEGHDEELLKVICRASKELVDEIIFHQKLLNAEDGCLILNKENFYVANLVDNLIVEFENRSSLFGVNISKLNLEIDFLINTDKIILSRILFNLIKNAIEASRKGQQVIVTYYKEGFHCVIEVRNQNVIPLEIQSKILFSTFSTKAVDRGLGLYSIKMFTEKYLQGKVSFNSTESDGTVFKLEIPMNDDAIE